MSVRAGGGGNSFSGPSSLLCTGGPGECHPAEGSPLPDAGAGFGSYTGGHGPSKGTQGNVNPEPEASALVLQKEINSCVPQATIY